MSRYRPATLSLFLLLTVAGCAHNKAMQTELGTCADELEQCHADYTSQDERIEELEQQLDDSESAGALANRQLDRFRDLAGQLRDALGLADLGIITRNGRMVVLFPNDILFDSGKSELLPGAEETTAKLAAVMGAFPERSFVIAGHTDNVSVTKKTTRFTTNWQLSTLRALTVVEALEAEGVSPSRIAAAGYGEHQPVTSNDTDEGKARNRRIEIIAMPRLDELPRLPDSL